MVTILPQRGAPEASFGSNLGKAVGQGFQQAAQPAIQQQYQRGQIQEALGGLKQLSNNPNATPTDIATALISATAGIPGAERYVGQLYESLMRERAAKGYFNGSQQGQQQQPNQGAQQGFNSKLPGFQTMGQQGQQGQPGQPQGANPFATGQPQGPTVPASNQGTPQLQTYTPEEMKAEAKRRASTQPDPVAAYPKELKLLQEENDLSRQYQKDVVETQGVETAREADILARDQNLRNFVAPKLVKGNAAANPEELNDFMLIGEQHENLKNRPAQWYDATKKDFDKMMNAKTAIDDVFNPGILTNLMRAGNKREQGLKNIEPVVKDLVKYGKEDYAREKLANMYLSPTEIEAQIRPLSPALNSEISKFPKAPYQQGELTKTFGGLGLLGEAAHVILGKPSAKKGYTYEEMQEKNPGMIDKDTGKVADFLKNNLTNNDSLLVLRDKIGRDWRQFNDALVQAEQNGLELNPRQQAERAELTRPPIQSLPDLFTEWGRWVDYLRGNK